MKLLDYLTINRIFLDIQPATKEEVLGQIVHKVVNRGELKQEFQELFLEKLLERENLKSTGIGHGIAIPHAIIDPISYSFVTLGICKEGTDFEAIDNQPVHIIVTLVGPLRDRPIHLKLLACIAKLMIYPEVPAKILQAQSESEVYHILEEKEKKIS
ncbi:MAG: PTS sugar transporter subunit IIA [Planctomycetota bacterium]|nr:MAG: PTS sugar transporter subunit IIA [Planctomycetota bacterium]